VSGVMSNGFDIPLYKFLINSKNVFSKKFTLFIGNFPMEFEVVYCIGLVKIEFGTGLNPFEIWGEI
jgi:hypothetical protein